MLNVYIIYLVIFSCNGICIFLNIYCDNFEITVTTFKIVDQFVNSLTKKNPNYIEHIIIFVGSQTSGRSKTIFLSSGVSSIQKF